MLNGSLLKVAQSKLPGTEHDYKTKFDARKFLRTYYETRRQCDDFSGRPSSSSSNFENDLLHFQLESLHYIYQQILDRKDNIEFSKSSKNLKPFRLLDVASGPSVAVALGASSVFEEIYLSDLNQDCKTELWRFLEYDAEAFDWSNVSRIVADLEGSDDEIVMERAREKVRNLKYLFSN